MAQHLPVLTLNLSRPVLPVLAAVLLAAMLGGCEDQAVQTARMQEVLDNAVAVVEAGEMGFIPGPVKTARYDEQNLGEPKQVALHRKLAMGDYRQTKLAEAVNDLEAVAGSSAASDAQKAAARRTLAMIEASSARYLQRAASESAAVLVGEAANQLLARLSLMERTAATADALEQNDAGLIATIDASLVELSTREKALSARVSELEAKLAAATAAETSQRDRAAAKLAEAQVFAGRAVTATGSAHYDLLDKEAAAKREAAVASIAADASRLDAGQIAVELERARLELRAAEDAIAAATAERAQSAERLAEATQARAALEEAFQAHYRELVDQFTALVARFDEQVIGTLDEAADRARAALEQLAEADKVASATSRDALSMSTLAVRADLAGVLTRQAVARHALVRTVEALDAGLVRLQVTESPISAALPALRSDRQARMEAARSAIEEAEALVGRVQNDQSDQVDRSLRTYRRHLDEPGGAMPDTLPSSTPLDRQPDPADGSDDGLAEAEASGTPAETPAETPAIVE